jgi:hypothetical protein
MARIWHSGLHQQGFFSYNYDISVDDREDDNPIEVDSFGDLRSKTHIFLTHCPFRADSCTSEQHNLYSNTVQDHFKDSYLNVILETHLDVDQSGGVFITEKTFKPIKNCQPFIVFGAKGTIQQLKRMGYRTFDHVIDHSYDGIENNTQRWNTAYQEFTRLISSDIHEIYLSCRADLEHNQRLFLSSKAQRLNILLEQSIKYATNRQ